MDTTENEELPSSDDEGMHTVENILFYFTVMG